MGEVFSSEALSTSREGILGLLNNESITTKFWRKTMCVPPALGNLELPHEFTRVPLVSEPEAPVDPTAGISNLDAEGRGLAGFPKSGGERPPYR